MKNYPKLRNAPIVEALINIEVEQTKTSNIEDLLEFTKDFKDYKKEKNLVNALIQIKNNDNIELESEKSPIITYGYYFNNNQEKKIAQLKLTGITFNKLNPYQNWETFINDFKGIWDSYKKIVEPQKIKNIAVRYMNIIEVPNDVSIGEYFFIYPEVSNEIKMLRNFYLMLDVYNSDKINTIITFGIAGSMKEENKIPITFDINTIYNSETDLENIWNILEELREIKNQMFFENITNNTVRLLYETKSSV